VETKTRFTPRRENDLDPYLVKLTDGYLHYEVDRAREADRDSLPGPTMFVRKSLDGFDMGRLKRGRRFVRQVALDNLAAQEIGVTRGRAIAPKPSEEYRKFLKDWQKIQWAREDAYSGNRPLEDLREDAPLRAILGGLQVFTPWRETDEDAEFADYVRELEKETHKRPKGYAPWRPQKKTVQLIRQVKQVLEEYRDYLPLTARQIFYRLVGTHGYPKTESAYKKLCEHLVRARRAKMIPFDQIRDDGISLMAHAHYADENAFYKHVHDEGNAYKRDKLHRQGLDIRVYSEAAGMMPQLERVCEPYSIPVYSCSGFDSLSGKYELKESCWRAFAYKGRRSVILHLGDHDPSGESIFSDGLVKDIHAFLVEDVPHKDPRDVADFERVALTEEHIFEYNLETEPPKASDSRTANWKGLNVSSAVDIRMPTTEDDRLYMNLAQYCEEMHYIEKEADRYVWVRITDTGKQYVESGSRRL